ncbi:MAG: TatD family hydrolase [Bacteroidales bacterium]|nr:TatD family hydrolase [Bacteroidales bacterium]
MLIDTHTHIYLKQFDEDREAVIQRAINAKVTKMFLPDINSKTRNSLFELAKNYPQNLFPMCGLHPTSVKTDYKKEIESLLSFFAENKNSIVAIGEIGIDLYWDKTFFKQQQEVFALQIELAIENNLPIVVHMRNSFNEIWDIFSNYHTKKPKIIFHCFSGSLEQAKMIVDKTYLLGIGGVLTFKNSDLKNIVKEIPLNMFVLETDAPYLAPVPYRGKRNEPAYIPLIASALSEAKAVDYIDVCRQTSQNAINIFKT